MRKKRRLVLLEKTFQEFVKDHHLKSLMKFKKHRFLHIILNQNVIGKDQWDIVVNDVLTHWDCSCEGQTSCMPHARSPITAHALMKVMKSVCQLWSSQPDWGTLTGH